MNNGALKHKHIELLLHHVHTDIAILDRSSSYKKKKKLSRRKKKNDDVRDENKLHPLGLVLKKKKKKKKR